MALIKSTLLAQISGSIAGSTFSHNRGGSYVRSRAMVSNPATTRQSEVRTALASLSTMWKDSLTQAQRDTWNNYGAGLSIVNRVGDSISLSGIAAFQRVNLFRMSTLGEAPIQAPAPAGDLPPGTEVPAFTSAAMINPVPPGVEITLTSNLGPNFGLAVYYSGPLSPGIQFYRGPYLDRVVETLDSSDSPQISLPLAPATAGNYVALKITLFDQASTLPIWSVYQRPLVTVAP